MFLTSKQALGKPPDLEIDLHTTEISKNKANGHILVSKNIPLFQQVDKILVFLPAGIPIPKTRLGTLFAQGGSRGIAHSTLSKQF
jgi:hypothetical protein